MIIYLEFNAADSKTLEERIAYTETGNPLNQNEPPKEPNTKSVRTSKWKLIINEYNNSRELYNLVDDPHEKNNLVGKNLSIEQETIFKELWNEFVKLQNTD